MSSSTSKLRVLCLHGKSQSGPVFSNKIGGARRKLSRIADLHFLDAPIVLPNTNSENETPSSPAQEQLAWWDRDSNGDHIHLHEAFAYIAQATQEQSYDALLGFSQGGTLATGVALSGIVPGVKAVITAGSPMVDEVFDVAYAQAQENNKDKDHDVWKHGMNIPKLHFAGENDAMIPVASTEALCERGGSGTVVKHAKGHLFPTQAAFVNQMMDFFTEHGHGS